MQFIQGTNRHQSYFSTLEDQVSADNAERLIDAFIDKLFPSNVSSAMAYECVGKDVAASVESLTFL